MYKAAARWMIRGAVRQTYSGDYRLAVSMFAEDARLRPRAGSTLAVVDH